MVLQGNTTTPELVTSSLPSQLAMSIWIKISDKAMDIAWGESER